MMQNAIWTWPTIYIRWQSRQMWLQTEAEDKQDKSDHIQAKPVDRQDTLDQKPGTSSKKQNRQNDKQDTSGDKQGMPVTNKVNLKGRGNT